MKQDSVLQLISLAMRAGGVASGEFMTEASVKEGKSRLVILSKDSSERTRKQFSDMCKYYEVPYREYSDKESLGHAIGKEFRASLSVTNDGLAKQILLKIDGGSN